METALNWIRFQVKAMGLTHQAMHEATGLSRANLNKIINGKMRLTPVATRKILVQVFRMTEKEAEAHMAQWKLEEAAQKARELGIPGYGFAEKPSTPQLIMVNDTKIKFATNTLLSPYMEKYFLLSFQCGEMIDSRYILPPEHVKDIYQLLGALITKYEKLYGTI